MESQNQADSSKQSLTSSAMIDLKAELHRKQEEFRRQRLDHGQSLKGRKIEKKLDLKKGIWNKQNRGVQERSCRDGEEVAEEEDELLKSRRMLAHKTKLYEEMATSKIIPNDDDGEGFLVDFQKKVVDRIVDERERERMMGEDRKEEEAEKEALAKPLPEADNPEDEWVEYTDKLGRSRQCMRKDLESMKNREADLILETERKGSIQGEESMQTDDPPDLMSNDMYRERMRQKWEDEAQALVDRGQKDIHYSNVQHDEIRSHGVGFFQFAKDSQERKEQLDELNKLRDQTLSETSRKDRIQAKRKALMESRLAKVRERRQLKEAPDMKKEAEEDNVAQKAQEEKKHEEEEKRIKNEEAERVAAEVRKNHLREWDKEKMKNSWVGKGYAEARRNEREAEFAPPSSYKNDKDNNKKKRHGGEDIETRMGRLKQATSKAQHNSEFAPPLLYFDNQPGNTKIQDLTNSTRPDYRADLKDSSSNNIPQQKKGNDLPLDGRIDIASIPLPGSNEDGKHTQIENSTQGFMDKSNKNWQPQGEFEQNYPVHQQPYCEGGRGQYHQNHQPQLHHPNHQQYQDLNCYSQHTVYATQPNHLHCDNQNLVNHPQMCHSTSDQHKPSSLQQHRQGPSSTSDYHISHPQSTHPAPNLDSNSQHHLSNKHYYNCQLEKNLHHEQQAQSSLRKVAVKRSAGHEDRTASQENSLSKKVKVSKSAIMDMRFMINDRVDPNDQSSACSDEPVVQIALDSVESVPYKPGSFTAARFPQGSNTASISNTEEVTSESKTQISGAAQLYTLEEREKQLARLEGRKAGGEEGKSGSGSKTEDDEKLDNFLASIRTETS